MLESVISHYRLIRQIGSGGMGVVYEAEDLSLGRHVALKLLPETVTSEESIERFRREARTASSLNHPAICTVYETGFEQGRHFLSMELLEGESLSERLRRGPFEVRPLIDFALHITGGLSAAHRKNIVHRDLKPANLFLTSYGQAKILDFGLAKLVDDGHSRPDAETAAAPLTQANAAVGTLEYMSPEQARGGQIDPRTDLFSLGAVLYETITCRRPFFGSTAALLFNAILNTDPIPPRTLDASIPPRLEEIILAMLEKDPDLRLQSADAVHTEFRRLQRDLEQGRAGAGEANPVSSAVRSRGTSSATRSTSRAAKGAQRPRRRGIAVLPFTNDSGNPELDYLSDGLTEVLINSLSGIAELRTVPRALAFHFRGRALNPAEIVRDLRVHTVVVGRLTRRASRLSVGVELLDLKTLEQIWGQQYSAEEQEIVGLDNTIAGDIITALRLNLTSEVTKRVSRRQTSNARALELYLKGRHAYARFFLAEPVFQAIEFARQALDLDPTFAAAWALSADGYALCGYFRYREPDSVFPKAKAAALKALELDPTLGEPHAALGLIYYIYEWDWNRAEQAFHRAEQLQAEGLGGGTSHAFLMVTLGRFGEAIELVERALKVDPLSAPVALAAAWIYFRVGEYEKAERQGKNALELDPNIYNTFEFMPMDILIDLRQGRGVQALMKYQAFLAEAKLDPAKSALPYIMAHAGMKNEVLGILQMADLSAADPVRMGTLYAALGDYDQAFAFLERGFEGRYRSLLEINVVPEFDPVRTDPRYVSLLQRMKLQV
ncbi:MAG TPA: protein kinase [Acidobacteriaceae bacterium]|nr:protein kinase [Acidobacteriaceae bacterium]